MAKQKFVFRITDREVDFSKWYTDVVKQAELVDYSSVRGCMIIKPYGYAIWEIIQSQLDKRFKETGHVNVYMPLLIPESLLEKEKEHVQGFAPEVAWVTQGGDEQLAERLCIRPTSETLFCEHYAKEIHSYRDLPKLYNQWCSVIRWEKTTRPFLRTLEFLWQEGHTAHATAKEAEEETINMLNLYAEFCENILAIPVIRGKKTDKEKFAGAKETYTIESLMYDGRALQSGTSHNFGDAFSKVFDIQYTNQENKPQYVHQTSWGMTTRLIGAVIMVHGDHEGLVLPPRLAPIQVVIIPVAQHKEGVLDKAYNLQAIIQKVARVKVDSTDKSPGWKFSEYEMKGIPIRLEIGPKEVEQNSVILVRRDTGERIIVSLHEVEQKISRVLESIQEDMLEKARIHTKEHTYTVTTMEEFTEVAEQRSGFIKAMWCGDQRCEEIIKEKTGVTSRCIPFEQEFISSQCVCCNQVAQKMVYWGKAY